MLYRLPERPSVVMMDHLELTKELTTLLPETDRHPYYFFGPGYSRASAGHRAFHLLIHWLNKLGEHAFLVPNLAEPVDVWTNPDLLTPILTRQALEHHQQSNVLPIVVYPEVLTGNPLQADVVVRYLANFPGALGGPTEFDASDVLFSYSSLIASRVGFPDNVLMPPVIDTGIFNPGPQPLDRRGCCAYFGKYVDYYKATPFGLPDNCAIITRTSPTPAQMADIFRRSEALYCFEDTAVALEATLCGCPVICMPNEHFKRLIAGEELGTDGLAWGDTPDEVARARATVGNVFGRYQKTIPRFFTQLEHFVSVTQEHASTAARTSAIHAEDYSWEMLPSRELAKLPQDQVNPVFRLRRYLGELRREKDVFRLIESIARWALRGKICGVGWDGHLFIDLRGKSKTATSEQRGKI